MKINEIFKSISGEAARAGYPVIFIRTFGCSLLCKYCDTLYAIRGNDYSEMTPHEILTKCQELGLKRVILTGGEPLIQKDAAELCNLLCTNGFEVEIETNGKENLVEFDLQITQECRKNLTYTMDYKTFASGMQDQMCHANLPFLTDKDVIKFVVGSHDDLDLMATVLDNNDIKAQVFVSPVFGKIEPKDIVQFILNHNLTECRVQLQLHKFIWPVDMRGV